MEITLLAAFVANFGTARKASLAIFIDGLVDFYIMDVLHEKHNFVKNIG